MSVVGYTVVAKCFALLCKNIFKQAKLFHYTETYSSRKMDMFKFLMFLLQQNVLSQACAKNIVLSSIKRSSV